MRSWYVIRYFTNTTKGTSARLFPTCECGAESTPDHGADHCPLVLKNRAKILRGFRYWFDAGKLTRKNSLFEYLHAVYFSIAGTVDKVTVKLVELMKTTITQLVLNDKSISGLPVKTISVEDEFLNDKEKLDDLWIGNDNVLDETIDLNETVLTAVDSELGSED